MAAWKRRGRLEPFHDKLVGDMLANGYTPQYAVSLSLATIFSGVPAGAITPFQALTSKPGTNSLMDGIAGAKKAHSAERDAQCAQLAALDVKGESPS